MLSLQSGLDLNLLSATNFSFAAHISEATTCVTKNLNSMFVIGCRKVQQRSKKRNMVNCGEEPAFEVDH